MRIPYPTSRDTFRISFRSFDIVWVVASPLVALHLSDAYVLSTVAGAQTVGLYCAASVAFSILAFLFLRIQDGIPRFFSAHDALEIFKAVMAAELLACATLFSITRLEGIPRSGPIIHALILFAGLIIVRALSRVFANNAKLEASRGTFATEHIIVIASNSLSSLYIKLLHSCGSSEKRVVAVLDKARGMTGRTIEGVRIVGSPEQLDTIIAEYMVHGVRVDRVVFGMDATAFSADLITAVRAVCEKRQISVDFLPQILGLGKTRPSLFADPMAAEYFELSPYFRWKRVIDFCAALVLIIILLPLLIGVGVVVLLDVGSPILFWQQRMGARGRWFLLYKYRTLRAPFDRRGIQLPASRRLSRIGQLLRDTSLDELPQLLNVLVGDMSLIGPRPLLPEDQPKNSTIRLMVSPGITGWAQVNGRKLLTPDEKDKLDGWYVRNASIFVDARIVLKTLHIVLDGARHTNQSGDISTVAQGIRGDFSDGQPPISSPGRPPIGGPL